MKVIIVCTDFFKKLYLISCGRDLEIHVLPSIRYIAIYYDILPRYKWAIVEFMAVHIWRGRRGRQIELGTNYHWAYKFSFDMNVCESFYDFNLFQNLVIFSLLLVKECRWNQDELPSFFKTNRHDRQQTPTHRTSLLQLFKLPHYPTIIRTSNCNPSTIPKSACHPILDYNQGTQLNLCSRIEGSDCLWNRQNGFPHQIISASKFIISYPPF